GAGHRARIEVVAADDDRRLQLPVSHHLVEGEARAMALAEPEPADSRRQALETDLFPGEVEPAQQGFVLREQIFHPGVGPRDVCRVARQRHPAEGTPPGAEHRSNVGRDEAGIVERVLQARVPGLLADIVAVVDAGDPDGLGPEARAHVTRARFARRRRYLLTFL